jgi:hypothetical protein
LINHENFAPKQRKYDSARQTNIWSLGNCVEKLDPKKKNNNNNNNNILRNEDPKELQHF